MSCDATQIGPKEIYRYNQILEELNWLLVTGPSKQNSVTLRGVFVTTAYREGRLTLSARVVCKDGEGVALAPSGSRGRQSGSCRLLLQCYTSRYVFGYEHDTYVRIALRLQWTLRAVRSGGIIKSIQHVNTSRAPSPHTHRALVCQQVLKQFLKK